MISGHVDTSDYGLSHTLNDSGAVRNCLAGIKLRWLSVYCQLELHTLAVLSVHTDKNTKRGSPTRNWRAALVTPGFD